MTAEPGLPANPWPAMWALVLGFFMILVDATIVSVAIPSLMAAFGTGITEVMWVTSAYLLAYAVPLLITGRLGDRVGPKRVYLTGLSIFTIASLACGLAPTIYVLIGARVVQGLGASLMTPQTMAVITRTFPRERRGSAMALWGATAGVATLVGPILGGYLIDQAGWEWIFFINVPVGVIGFVLALRLVPRLVTHAHTFDWLGVALSAVGMFCAVFGIQEGNTFNWGVIWNFISVPLLIGAGAALLLVFIWWQARNKREPLVPLSLFTDRNFSLANIGVITVGFAVTSMIFPFMIYAQVVRGLSPTHAALLLAPQALASMALAPIAGVLADRVHPAGLTSFGLFGLALTVFGLSRVMTPTSPTWHILVLSLTMGISQSFVWGPLSTTANRNLPMAAAGAGAGVYNTTRQMGSVMGSAAITALMQARLVTLLPGHEGAPVPAMGESGSSLPPMVADAFGLALSQAMLLPAAVLVLGGVAVSFFEKPHFMSKTP